jgi:hypothetical protein
MPVPAANDVNPTSEVNIVVDQCPSDITERSDVYMLTQLDPRVAKEGADLDTLGANPALLGHPPQE